jgi:hypothetical protein
LPGIGQETLEQDFLVQESPGPGQIPAGILLFREKGNANEYKKECQSKPFHGNLITFILIMVNPFIVTTTLAIKYLTRRPRRASL